MLDGSLMKASDFFEKYEMKNVNMISFHYKKKHKYVHKIESRLFIDENALLAWREFNKKVWLRSHELYFEINARLNDSELAAALGYRTKRKKTTWRDFLEYRLFSTAQFERSLFVYEPPEMFKEFFREAARIAAIYRRHPNRDKYEDIRKERGVFR